MRITTVIVGAGQAGLAMSRCLTQRSIDHVVLERGEVADSWRTGRWDSLRLLTPNWMTRLPGYRYQGDDPDGYMRMPEVVSYLDRYAGVIGAPVQTGTEVCSVSWAAGSSSDGYVVTTANGSWSARTVVLASGAYNAPHVPAIASALPPGIASLTPLDYRNPGQLDPGGVMVVGAGATGIQLADEIHRSGRPVTVAVGGHVRVPRTYRGMDIMWWLDAAGILDERYDEMDDINRARNLPSFQLVGSPERTTIDLNALQDIGVTLVGRFAGITPDGTAQFSGSLLNQCTLADLKLRRLLENIDAWAAERGEGDAAEPPERYPPTRVEASPPLMMKLKGRFSTVIWATGFHSSYPWLHVPVLDRKGQVRHDGGVVTASPGLYLLGNNFLRRRKSTFIDGVGDDARELTEHLVGYLGSLAGIPCTASRSRTGPALATTRRADRRVD